MSLHAICVKWCVHMPRRSLWPTPIRFIHTQKERSLRPLFLCMDESLPFLFPEEIDCRLNSLLQVHFCFPSQNASCLAAIEIGQVNIARAFRCLDNLG